MMVVLEKLSESEPLQVEWEKKTEGIGLGDLGAGANAAFDWQLGTLSKRP
jgi:hypothetical protein